MVNIVAIHTEVILSNLSNGAFRVYCYLAARDDEYLVTYSEVMSALGIKQKRTLEKYHNELVEKGFTRLGSSQ